MRQGTLSAHLALGTQDSTDFATLAAPNRPLLLMSAHTATERLVSMQNFHIGRLAHTDPRFHA